MNLPKVNILIPTYNRAEYLVDALESSLAQDYPNLEIIVSDNASTDNTQDIVKKYLNDKRLKYVRTESNTGGAQNWLDLIYKHASGEYATFLCDDDYFINKKHISEAIALMKKHNTDYCISNGAIIDLVLNRYSFQGLGVSELLKRDWFLNNIENSIYPTPLFVFNVKKAKELEIFLPEVYGGDFEIGLRFMLNGDISCLDGLQRAMRYHKENDSKVGKIDFCFTALETGRRIYEFGLKKGINKTIMKKLRTKVDEIRVFHILPPWVSVNSGTLRSFIKLYFKIKTNENYRYKSLWFYLKIFVSKAALHYFLRYSNKNIFSIIKRIYEFTRKDNVYNKLDNLPDELKPVRNS